MPRKFTTRVSDSCPEVSSGDRRECHLIPGDYLCLVAGFSEPFIAKNVSYIKVMFDAIAQDGQLIKRQPAPDYWIEYTDDYGFAEGFRGEGKWRQFLDATKMFDSGEHQADEFVNAPVVVRCVDGSSGGKFVNRLFEPSDANVQLALQVIQRDGNF